jgi:hypothetical protein
MRSRKSKRASIKQKSVAIFWMALPILFIWSRAFAAAPINGEALPGLDGFDKAIIKFIEKHNIPGGSLAVSFKGKLILAKGYGYADFSVFKKVPVHPELEAYYAARRLQGLPGAWLFQNPRTGGPYSVQALRKIWTKVKGRH